MCMGTDRTRTLSDQNLLCAILYSNGCKMFIHDNFSTNLLKYM